MARICISRCGTTERPDRRDILTMTSAAHGQIVPWAEKAPIVPNEKPTGVVAVLPLVGSTTITLPKKGPSRTACALRARMVRPGHREQHRPTVQQLGPLRRFTAEPDTAEHHWVQGNPDADSGMAWMRCRQHRCLGDRLREGRNRRTLELSRTCAEPL